MRRIKEVKGRAGVSDDDLKRIRGREERERLRSAVTKKKRGDGFEVGLCEKVA